MRDLFDKLYQGKKSNLVWKTDISAITVPEKTNLSLLILVKGDLFLFKKSMRVLCKCIVCMIEYVIREPDLSMMA